MRKCQYYSQFGGVKYAYYLIRYNKLGKKLGISIGCNAFGYGLVIPHYATIVVGGNNKCGNYCVLHTSPCITDSGKVIGNALSYLTGAKIIKPMDAWYIRDGQSFLDRVYAVENLKHKMDL